MAREISIADHLDILLPSRPRQSSAPLWPPDLFAIVSSLLVLSGGYCEASCDWPPKIGGKTWAKSTEDVGLEWRRTFTTKVPKRVQSLWRTLLLHRQTAIASISKDRPLCRVLLELVAICDEASHGAGVPVDLAFSDEFDARIDVLLVTSNNSGNGANLCDLVRGSTVRILPKMHVPQSGLTIRSFSHHLAIVMNSEITPFWHPAGIAPTENKTLDLLLLPWPLTLTQKNFRQVKPIRATMRNMPKEYGFFEFHHQNPVTLIPDVLKIVQHVVSQRGNVDAVIMPESSLSDREYEHLSQVLFNQGIYLIAGVGGAKNGDGTTQNCVRFNFPLGSHSIPVSQPKHHRWKIDQKQAENYGLSLPKRKSLWEHIPLGDRSLTFICLRDWLALCVLVCEDLARPDPVGDLIRAVGPNLVIALLLDGPQLERRWSARYATTLADDPGSSVLTLTCAGMTKLSNPPGLKKSNQSRGKIALWKDVRGQAQVIDVADGDAALLHIEVTEREEWTADGRTNGGGTGYPLLKKVSIFKNHKEVKSYDV
jgi:hypothetical protein